jgi:hypothetical protein
MRKKYCWLVADKPDEQGAPLVLLTRKEKTISRLNLILLV